MQKECLVFSFVICMYVWSTDSFFTSSDRNTEDSPVVKTDGKVGGCEIESSAEWQTSVCADVFKPQKVMPHKKSKVEFLSWISKHFNLPFFFFLNTFLQKVETFLCQNLTLNTSAALLSCVFLPCWKANNSSQCLTSVLIIKKEEGKRKKKGIREEPFNRAARLLTAWLRKRTLTPRVVGSRAETGKVVSSI